MSLKIWEEVKRAIKSGLIEQFNITDVTPLIQTEVRKMFGVCADNKESGRALKEKLGLK